MQIINEIEAAKLWQHGEMAGRTLLRAAKIIDGREDATLYENKYQWLNNGMKRLAKINGEGGSIIEMSKSMKERNMNVKS